MCQRSDHDFHLTQTCGALRLFGIALTRELKWISIEIELENVHKLALKNIDYWFWVRQSFLIATIFSFRDHTKINKCKANEKNQQTKKEKRFEQINFCIFNSSRHFDEMRLTWQRSNDSSIFYTKNGRNVQWKWRSFVLIKLQRMPIFR